jgi:hypothetical protein
MSRVALHLKSGLNQKSAGLTKVLTAKIISKASVVS